MAIRARVKAAIAEWCGEVAAGDQNLQQLWMSTRKSTTHPHDGMNFQHGIDDLIYKLTAEFKNGGIEARSIILKASDFEPSGGVKTINDLVDAVVFSPDFTMPSSVVNVGVSNAGDTKHQVTFVGSVKTDATAVHLFLDNVEMNMKKDGDTWSGKKPLEVDNTVAVKFTVKGIEGSAWAVEVDVDCPKGAVKLMSQSGKIGTPGGSGFEKTVKVPADPCGNS